MAVENYIIIDAKKFIWDGQNYASQADAKAKADAYTREKFEVQVIQGEEGFLVYSRRLVTDIVLEGEAPV